VHLTVVHEPNTVASVVTKGNAGDFANILHTNGEEKKAGKW